MAGISSGQILRVGEMLQLGARLDGRSVRTWGRAVSHDIENSQVRICDNGLEALIDISLVEPIALNRGSMYQFIGEVNFTERPILKARVACCIDGMDMGLFNQALDIRRKYLKEKIFPDS